MDAVDTEVTGGVKVEPTDSDTVPDMHAEGVKVELTELGVCETPRSPRNVRVLPVEPTGTVEDAWYDESNVKRYRRSRTDSSSDDGPN